MQPRRDLDLRHLAADRIEARIERHVAAERRVHAHRAGDQGAIEHGLRPEQADQRKRGRDLGAVQQRQALLGAERERPRADAGERLGRRHDGAAEAGLALADQDAGEVGERRQVARRADRSLGRDHRQGVVLEEREQELDGAPAHARIAERQAGRLERQDQTDHGIGQGRAQPAHVRQHEPTLQLLDLVRRDAHGRELAEAGVDAIDRRAASGRPRHHLRRRLDRGPAAFVEFQSLPAFSESAQLVKSQSAGGHLGAVVITTHVQSGYDSRVVATPRDSAKDASLRSAVARPAPSCSAKAT